MKPIQEQVDAARMIIRETMRRQRCKEIEHELKKISTLRQAGVMTWQDAQREHYLRRQLVLQEAS